VKSRISIHHHYHPSYFFLLNSRKLPRILAGFVCLSLSLNSPTLQHSVIILGLIIRNRCFFTTSYIYIYIYKKFYMINLISKINFKK
jgi:hypothetical protein